MNKKIARKRKKFINQVREHRVLPNGRILSHDGRETLLGNLAPVKHIPMLPWKRVIAFPTEEKQISVAAEGKNCWLYELLEKSRHQAHDLIGFTPVRTLDSTTFEQAGAGSVGIAVQVLKIEPPENGRAKVHLKGICRYENAGFMPSGDDYFNISVRWFEDNREPDSLIRPEFEKCMEIFNSISDTLYEAGIQEFKKSRDPLRFEFTAAQYLSFSLLESAQNYFEPEEIRQVFLTRSTSARFKKLNEYFEGFRAEVERRFKKKAEKQMNSSDVAG